MQVVVTTDTLVAGIHFPEHTHPADIGYKALAVNLSDLAAMGATPAWFTLNLTLPQAEPAWLESFAAGLLRLAREHGIRLVGGDTTRGPLSLTVSAFGLVPVGQALLRAGARPGDGIYVTGMLGDAAIGLRFLRGGLALPEEYRATVVSRLNRPTPRMREGQALRGLASACVDVSDGLLADLGHILAASGQGATIELKRLPVSPAFDAAFPQLGWPVALAGGDDYELCFTVPAERESALHAAGARFASGVARIGGIEAEPGLRVLDESGELFDYETVGYNHFLTP
jgi:thiamine-monophosphate kinase